MVDTSFGKRVSTSPFRQKGPTFRLPGDQPLLLLGIEAVAHGHRRDRHRPVADENLIGLGVFQTIADGQRRRDAANVDRRKRLGRQPAGVTAFRTTRTQQLDVVGRASRAGAGRTF